MAEIKEIDLEAILKRLEFLEKENLSLRAEVMELKSNDIEIKSELNTINRFISAMTESQSVDEVMTEIESAAKQLTESDKVTFYCMDSVNQKFFSENDGRSWQSKADNELLQSVSDKQEITKTDRTAYIPLVSGDGKTLGVIAAEKSTGFNSEDVSRKFDRGGTFVENVKPGLLKEYEHQGRITDELTQMYNRQGLNEYLENTVVKALSEGRSVNILMSDIDKFKSVNDTYGHDAGDVILKGTAEVIKELANEGASGCFRMGGEEMVAILITDTPEQAIEMAENLRRNVENNVNEIMADGKPMDYSVTVSIGIHEMQPDVPVTKENARMVFDAEFKQADNAVYIAKETGRNKVVCADEKNYISYLAMKAAEVFVKAEGLEAPDSIKSVKDMIADSIANPTQEQGLPDIVDALRTYAVQTSEDMPDISALADMIADKAEAFAEEINAEIIPEDELTASDAVIEEDNRTQGENVFDIIAAATPENLISVEQNGYIEYLKTDKPIQDILLCCAEDKPYKAIAELAGEHISEADFAYDNQSKNILAVEINIDSSTISAYNNEFTANIPLDKAISDMTAVFPKESPYYTPEAPNGNTFAEKVTAMKEWAEKATEKAAEKDKAIENKLKKDEGAR